MAEVKNTFLQSKMNKDLDSRLLPNGQYRNAQNININKSEGPDAGAIENIISNLYITNFGIVDTTAEIIGRYFDEVNERIYVFITNYNDASIDLLSNNSASFNSTNVSSSEIDVTSCLAYYDFASGDTEILLYGSWLNFSKTHPIININLIENLLFFTDNRNQPRKINVDSAINNPYDLTVLPSYNNPYYINEDQISVAKYYPYNPIALVGVEEVLSLNQTVAGSGYTVGATLNATTVTGSGSGLTLIITSANGNATIGSVGSGYVTGNIVEAPLTIGQPSPAARYTVVVGSTAGMQDVTSELLPQAETVEVTSGGTYAVGSNIAVTSTSTNLVNWVGSTIKLKTSSGAPTIPDGTRVTSITNTGGQNYNIVLTKEVVFIASDEIYLGANPVYDPNFLGDEDYLTDKFIKFAYRFKFDDNEYSLISTFTEECFIPKQDGYFLGGPFSLDGNLAKDPQRTFESTIVSFMENKVDEITFRLQAPDKTDGNQMTWQESVDLLKIDSIDIIYSDSDGNSFKIIDTIKKDKIQTFTGKTYLYKYKSQKPIRVLPESDVVRTSDKVPIRARTQETAGNRIIYGNFTGSLGRPAELDYNVQIDEKFADVNSGGGLEIATEPKLRIEYPNHTVKQNRNYQVGVILVDRYGRQSDVILSSNDSDSFVSGFGGSTIYHPYRSSNQRLSTFVGNNRTDVWPGDSIKVLFNNVIPETDSTNGYAGLYSSTNPLGWYSYKIVVKQQQQEYYNVYLPGIVNGFPRNSIAATNNVVDAGAYDDANAHVVLFSDNINKIPRDLAEVGPEQKEFRASEPLYGRLTPGRNRNAVQFYPEITADIATVIGTYADLNLDKTKNGGAWTDNARAISPFYTVAGNKVSSQSSNHITFQNNSNSLIAQISTKKAIGLVGGIDPSTPQPSGNVPTANIAFNQNSGLAVYETEPVFSNLDIFYETNTSGRISSLNTSILAGDTVTPVSLQPLNFNYSEDEGPLSAVSSDFYPLANAGVILNNPNTTCTIVGPTSSFNNFEVVAGSATNSFKIRTKSGVYNWYGSSSHISNNYRFDFVVTNVDGNGNTLSSNITVLPPNLLANAQPGWVDNGGSLGPPTTGNTPYTGVFPNGTGFNITYAPHTGFFNGTSVSNDPFPSWSALAFSGNTWNELVALNGFNGSAGDGSSGNIPFYIKNQLLWVPTKVEFYWTGKPGGAAYEEFSPNTTNSISAFGGTFPYSGDITLNTVEKLAGMSIYSNQAYSNVPETVFHRLRALNHSATTLDPYNSNGTPVNNPLGSVAQYVYPAQPWTGAGTSPNAGNPVYGLSTGQSGAFSPSEQGKPTLYRITLEVRDEAGSSGFLSRELQLEFYVTPNSFISNNLTQTASGGGGGGGNQGDNSEGG
jgi:hypothetical protein